MGDDTDKAYIIENALESMMGRSNTEIAPERDSDRAEEKKQSDMGVSKRALAMIAYVPFLWVTGILAYPSDSEVQFHVNQGILLNTAYLALGLAMDIISGVFVLISPIMLFITTLLYVVFGVVTLIFTAMGMLNAYHGRLTPLPVIGNIYTFVG